MSRVAEYQTLIDWHGHGGLAMNHHGWEAMGEFPPSTQETAEEVVFGSRSLKVEWGDTGALRLDGTSGTYAWTANHASFSGASIRLAMQADIHPDSWRPSGEQNIMSRYDDSTNNRSFQLALMPTGHLRANISQTGTGPTRTYNSTIPMPSSTGRIAVAVEIRFFGDRTEATFYTADFYVPGSTKGYVPGSSISLNRYKQFGDVVVIAGAVSVFAGNAELKVGARNPLGQSTRFEGSIYAAQLHVDGLNVANPVFLRTSQDVPFVDSTGKSWAVAGNAAVTTVPYSVRMEYRRRAPRNRDFMVSVWTYVPSGQPNIVVDVVHLDLTVGTPQVISTKDQWVRTDIPRTATVNDQRIVVYSTVDTGSTAYIGRVMVTTADDDVTCDVLTSRQPPDLVYGKDAGRELERVRSGQTAIELDNSTGKYTPHQGVGVRPVNRQMIINATTETGITSNLFVGFTDDYIVEAHPNRRSISVTAVDLITRLGDTRVSTELYPSIRTGDAIKAILDSADVTYSDEDIDSGATILRWWAASGQDAIEAINEVVGSEGHPATYTVSDQGSFVYHDRLHRKRLNYPAPDVTLLPCRDDVADPDTEFYLDSDSSVDSGWTTLYNRVDVRAAIVGPSKEISTVWEHPSSTLNIRGTMTFTADVEGFVEGVSPVAGRLVLSQNPGPDETNVEVGIVPDDPDYIVERGEVSLVEFAESGSQVRIVLRSSGGATIRNLRFRARAISVVESAETFDDLGSQTYYESVRPYTAETGRATPDDARDIALWTLRQYAYTRAKADLIVKNYSPEALDMILTRDLGGPVQVDMGDRWGATHTFAIEGMRHSIREAGHEHVLTMYAEQAERTEPAANVFTFDEAGKGFDDGVFGETEHTDEPFILGVSEIGSDHELWY